MRPLILRIKKPPFSKPWNMLAYHKSIRFFVLFLFSYLIISCGNKNSIDLVNNGKSNYKIILGEQADSITRYAATELQFHIAEISGAMLEITIQDEKVRNHQIILSKTDDVSVLENEPQILNEDGFSIHTHDGQIIFKGGNEKGILYSVYTFLEDYFSCRMYSDVLTYSYSKNISLPEISIHQEPCFDFRELHMPIARQNQKYRDWHKLDMKEGKNAWGLFVHTFDDFIPYEKYFKRHPEYFSSLNGIRIPDGQLCLSNPDVLEITISYLKEKMKEKPEALFWSVSQNDTYKPCECDNCKKEYEEYDGYSGAMVHFVNKVAEEFPDKVISTLAYQYTRSAPTKIKPADNVNIMFCSIECNRSRPLKTDESSASFRKDTEDWCKLTHNIFMWDYVVQFRNLVSPFPNLRVLQPNIQFFRDNGIKMMFQQGSGGLISEFVELRSYIIAKLLWDPDADVEELIVDFTNGYYGSAGIQIRQYIEKMHNALDSTNGDLGIYGYPYDGIITYLTPELIKNYEKIFDEAETLVLNQPTYLERIKTARLPLEFAIIDISLRNVNDELTLFKKEENKWIVREEMLKKLDDLTEKSIAAGITRYWEHGNYPKDYQETIRRYANASMQNHIALKKTVVLKTPASKKYPVGEGMALTDGLKGINDYHFNWLGFEGPDMEATIDLEEIKKINSIEMDFLQEIKSWVFLPEKVEFYIAEDGENFKKLGVIENKIPKKKKGTFIETFKLYEPANARFIRVHAKNMGTCPDWHPGATHPSWIFCDEIIVW
jgi:hypothetical protein